MFYYEIDETVSQYREDGSSIYVLGHKKKFSEQEFSTHYYACRDELAGFTPLGKQRKSHRIECYRVIPLMVTKFSYIELTIETTMYV